MPTFMNDVFFREKGFQISSDPDLVDFEVIYHYLHFESHWAAGIPAEKLKAAIKNSFCFGVYMGNSQAGFARVVTDKATFAYICDVFILPEFRALGLSKWLIQTIVNHPELKGLRRWSLATADAHSLYSQFGFTQITNPEKWMEIFTPYKVKEQ
jgi:GNAT superfamily N-acetyltransferase